MPHASGRFLRCGMPEATRLIIHVLAAVAEHEHEMIAQAVRPGRDRGPEEKIVEQMLVVECQRCAFSSSRRIRNEPLSEIDISLMKRRGLALGCLKTAAGTFHRLLGQRQISFGMCKSLDRGKQNNNRINN
jgi:hypothetical protein